MVALCLAYYKRYYVVPRSAWPGVNLKGSSEGLKKTDENKAGARWGTALRWRDSAIAASRVFIL